MIQYEPAKSGDYIYPGWANVLGWGISLLPISIILGMMAEKYFTCDVKGTFCEVKPFSNFQPFLHSLANESLVLLFPPLSRREPIYKALCCEPHGHKEKLPLRRFHNASSFLSFSLVSSASLLFLHNKQQTNANTIHPLATTENLPTDASHGGLGSDPQEHRLESGHHRGGERQHGHDARQLIRQSHLQCHLYVRNGNIKEEEDYYHQEEGRERQTNTSRHSKSK